MSITTNTFIMQKNLLHYSLINHPRIGNLFNVQTLTDKSIQTDTYIDLLKMTAKYVQFTVPMLQASGNALANGDDEDKKWSKLFLDYATDEIDKDYGHHVWAIEDAKALGCHSDILMEPKSEYLKIYEKCFVMTAQEHPYAILGAKGVLEHLSITICDDLVAALIEKCISSNIKNAVSFFSHHGSLDVEHVKEGDKNISSITNENKVSQIIMGAYITSGSYKSFLSEI